MSEHLLGRYLNGVPGIYDDTITDMDYRVLVASGLPKGWFAVHLEDGETVENSERIRRFVKLPKIVANGDYGSERLEYGVSAMGGAATQYSTPMADVRNSFFGAQRQDAMFDILDRIAPTDVPTNESSYVNALANALIEAAPNLDKASAHSYVHGWVRSQPEYVIVDNILGGVHETKEIIEDPVKLATRLIVDLSAAPRHIIRNVANGQPAAFQSLCEKIEIVQRESQ